MATEAIKKITLRANDLNCPSCVSKIEKSLNSLDGVDRAAVHFNTGRIAVEHDPSRASVDDLVRAVANAGYTANPSAF
jgi:copper chaperone CopZ